MQRGDSLPLFLRRKRKRYMETWQLKHGDLAGQHRTIAAQHKGVTVQHGDSAAQHGDFANKHGDLAAGHRAFASMQASFTAKHGENGGRKKRFCFHFPVAGNISGLVVALLRPFLEHQLMSPPGECALS